MGCKCMWAPEGCCDTTEGGSVDWKDIQNKPFDKTEEKTVIFSGDVEMVGTDLGEIAFTEGIASTGLSSIPDEVTITVDGISTVVKTNAGSFPYNGKTLRVDISRDDDGNWSEIQFHQDGINNYTINDITIEAVIETIHPIDPEFIVLTSTNGTKYNLTVADDGTLSAVKV